jgi:hypothetical protein
VALLGVLLLLLLLLRVRGARRVRGTPAAALRPAACRAAGRARAAGGGARVLRLNPARGVADSGTGPGPAGTGGCHARDTAAPAAAAAPEAPLDVLPLPVLSGLLHGHGAPLGRTLLARALVRLLHDIGGYGGRGVGG